MTFYDILKKKRDGHELEREEIEYVVTAAVEEQIADYQISAFLMAAFINGLSERETAALTLAMAYSGRTMDLSQLGNVVDKHSTGGVADTTTLIVAPLVAACGVPVAKLTGRGLGHTGGTVDKLESIPGLSTALSMQQFVEQVQAIGIALMSATRDIAPADRIFYAIRDVTATVDSIPLIASSIMSKKIASGATHIVLDVKFGSGAFMKTAADAEALARSMVEVGTMTKRPTTALLTRMDEPLGSSIGNTLEVLEAMEILRGDGGSEPLREVCMALAMEMLLLHNPELQADEALRQLKECIANGSAYDKFVQMVEAQGGDLGKDLPLAKEQYTINAPWTGYIKTVDPLKLGQLSVQLGAGRAKKEDSIDYGAGILLKARTGDYVEQGQPLALLYANKGSLEDLAQTALSAFEVSTQAVDIASPVFKRIVSVL